MPSTAAEPALHVAVGVLRGPGGRVFTAQRRPGTPGAGEWEFPGGKVEPGETAEQALGRELREEIGIRVTVCRPLIRTRYPWPDRVVILDTWEILTYEGEPHGREGQRTAWVEPENLRCPPLLSSSAPIVEAIQRLAPRRG